jgi:type I restriction enzyme S subunit
MSKTSENKLVPRYRFPEFKEDGEWEEKDLNEIAKYENGKAHEQDIQDTGKFIVINSKFISTDGEVKKFTNSALCLANKADILMVLSDIPNGKAIAKCFLVDKDNLYTVNQRICKITTQSLNSTLLYYLLNRNPYFLSFDDGVNQTNIRKEDVLSCPLLIPSDFVEQKKIACTLFSLDVVITAELQKLEVLKKYKKGLLQNLFPQEGEIVPKFRFKEFEDSGEWEEKPLYQVAPFVNEKMSIENISINSYISTENLLPNYSGVTLISKLPTSGNFTKYREGDMLVSNIRPYLKKVWLADKNGACSNDVIVIRTISVVSNTFLSSLLKNDVFIDYIMKNVEGVKMPRGDKDSIKRYPIKFPKDKMEQQKIVETLSSIDELINAQSQKVEELKLHKKGLLRGLFPIIK